MADPMRESPDFPTPVHSVYDPPMINNAERPAASLRSTERYGSMAIAFHWITVALVIVVGVLGLLHDSWPRRTQAFWINIHAQLGLVLWVLVMVRVWWRSRHAPPHLPADVGELSRRVSACVHGLLYVLIFLIPILGVVTFIWHGRVFDFGLLRLNPGIRANRAIFHPTEEIHGYLAYTLFALAGMHTLAAIWHHFIRRDGVLRRMWPSAGTRSTS
jgi:cytochrome b561